MNILVENKLFVPAKLKVGFQNRQDCYTGKLAYVVYYNAKNKLRKETSWEGWRDKKIAPVEYDNVPTEGFVLNKRVGGGRSYDWYDWVRDTKVRIFDPRGFEFEITVPNLLYILQEADCSRGKGLEGKFLYAWDKKDLVLLPAGSQQYKDSAEFTLLQNQRVKVKDLIPGATYVTKQQEEMIFLGRLPCNFMRDKYGYTPSRIPVSGNPTEAKLFVFRHGDKFRHYKNTSRIATCKIQEPAENYAELMEAFQATPQGSSIASLELVPAPPPSASGWYESLWRKLEDGYYEEYRITYESCTTSNRSTSRRPSARTRSTAWWPKP